MLHLLVHDSLPLAHLDLLPSLLVLTFIVLLFLAHGPLVFEFFLRFLSIAALISTEVHIDVFLLERVLFC